MRTRLYDYRPIGHSELHPIDHELIWAQVKSKVARKNTTFRITDVKVLITNGLKNVTKKNWPKTIEHVQKVEDAFRKVDFGHNAPFFTKCIIEVNNSESSSESEMEEDYS